VNAKGRRTFSCIATANSKRSGRISPHPGDGTSSGSRPYGTADGALVVNVPADHVFFTSSLAGFFRAARSGLDDLAGVSGKQLWIAGGMSPMARKWIEESGWTVHIDARKRLLPGI
jgi:hypothetical protein